MRMVLFSDGNAVPMLFKVFEAAHLPLVPSAQQTELHALTQTCVRKNNEKAKGKTTKSILIIDVFGVAHDLECYRNNRVSSLLLEIKLRICCMPYCCQQSSCY